MGACPDNNMVYSKGLIRPPPHCRRAHPQHSLRRTPPTKQETTGPRCGLRRAAPRWFRLFCFFEAPKRTVGVRTRATETPACCAPAGSKASPAPAACLAGTLPRSKAGKSCRRRPRPMTRPHRACKPPKSRPPGQDRCSERCWHGDMPVVCLRTSAAMTKSVTLTSTPNKWM